jgi:hypothetical protein
VTGHAIGSIGILAGRSEVKFPDYLRGGGLRDLLYFIRGVLIGRRNRSVDIKLDIGIGELVDAPPQAEKSPVNLSQNRLATMVLSSIWKIVARE